MVQTILSLLSKPNAALDRSRLPGGPNTSAWGPIIETWDHWESFTYRKLSEQFQNILDAPWHQPPSIPSLSRFDCQLFNEESFEHQVLSVDTIPTVNKALEHARHLIKNRGGFSDIPHLRIARGSLCSFDESSHFRSDWALVDPYKDDDYGKLVCLVPGDTKISSKWHNTVSTTDTYISEQDWAQPINQVAGYADRAGTRYGFIITDAKLTVMRFHRETIGPGLATNRSTREQRVASGQSTLSSLSASIQSMALSDMSWVDDNKGLALHAEYYDISWDTHGPKTLTVRLGLFFLCMLAGHGPHSMLTTYPDSSTIENNRGQTVNVMGATRTSKESGEHGVDKDEDEDRGSGGDEVAETGGEETETEENARDKGKWPEAGSEPPDRFVIFQGTQFWRRRAVEELRFDHNRKQYVSESPDGASSYIERDTAVYDDDAQDWGYFIDGDWTPVVQSSLSRASNSRGESSRDGEIKMKKKRRRG